MESQLNNKPLSPVRTAIFQPASSLSSKTKFVCGLMIVLVIATSSVGSTQTARSTLSGSFKAPFFIVWIGTSCMMSVYPLVYLWQLLYKRVTSSSHDESWCQYFYSNTASFLRYISTIICCMYSLYGAHFMCIVTIQTSLSWFCPQHYNSSFS